MGVVISIGGVGRAGAFFYAQVKCRVWRRYGSSVTSRTFHLALLSEARDALEEALKQYDHYSHHYPRTTRSWLIALT